MSPISSEASVKFYVDLLVLIILTCNNNLYTITISDEIIRLDCLKKMPLQKFLWQLTARNNQ